MPKPVINSQTGSFLAEIPSGNQLPFTVRVHEWMEAASIEPSKAVDRVVADQVGVILAALHGINETNFRSELAPGFDTRGVEAWEEINQRVADSNIAWARELKASLGAVTDAEALVEAASKSKPQYLLTHGDIDQKNLLRRGDGVFLIDWDVCNAMPARHELVRCALDLADWAVGPSDVRVCATRCWKHTFMRAVNSTSFDQTTWAAHSRRIWIGSGSTLEDQWASERKVTLIVS